MGKSFWLGIIGGIFGILAGIGVALIAGVLGDFSGVLHIVIVGISEVYNSTGSSGFHTITVVPNVPALYVSAVGVIVFSIVGIVGGILEKIESLVER